MTLTRREFARLGALGLAARFAPALQAQDAIQKNGRKTGYAIIGLGRIADIFMSGVVFADNSSITGLVSGHRDKADRIAAQYGVPASSIYNYDNFDEIAHNRAVDAVYVALPNSMHAEYTIRAAKAGKHVLCEKPMCTTVADAEAMIAACKKANVKLMIAYRCQYEPTNLRAIEIIRSGALGSVQSIQSAFGFNIRPGEWRLNKKMAGGGPLVDVGIYCLNATRYLTGENPVEFKGYTSVVDHDGRFDQVEENVTWSTKFPSGIVASCLTTLQLRWPPSSCRVRFHRARRTESEAQSISVCGRGGAFLALRPVQPGAENRWQGGAARHGIHGADLQVGGGRKLGMLAQLATGIVKASLRN
jgi:predicted dehydrogenase